MKRAARILVAVGASFAGGFFCARATETEFHCTADTFTETRTVVRTVQTEAERSAQATERIIERRIAVPCKCPKVVLSEMETATDKDTNVPSKESTSDGILVMDERIIERAMGTTERLKIDGFSESLNTLSAMKEKPAEQAVRLPRWRLGLMAGYDWTDAVPIYGLSAGMRLVGPIEIGVWATVSQRLHGAVGLSVSAAW